MAILAFGLIFLAALTGQAIAGHAAYNQDQLEHSGQAISMSRYLTSSSFGRAVTENWQSEYLQFMLYLMGTIWLVQRGSPESKPLEDRGLESDEKQMIGRHAKPDSPAPAKAGGWRALAYGNSLLILMGLIFFGSWIAQSFTGWTVYNQDQAEHHSHAISWLSYVGNAEFWEATLQNWQSEFLAIGSFSVFAIYLRQRGSPESKPVGAAHSATGVES